jgi:hypothetical protein
MSITRALLEQIQVDKKYNLSTEQVEQLVRDFDFMYAAEVMIEMGHTNEEIKDATGIGGCKLSWMRTKYATPPARGELELQYSRRNIDYIHKESKLEREFCKLFRCGRFHKDHKQLIARVEL